MTFIALHSTNLAAKIIMCVQFSTINLSEA
jgi:hypothetical protein